MDYLKNILKKTGWNSLLTSIVFAILGLILIMKPQGTVKIVSMILGIMFILVGAYKIINYIVTKGKYNLYNYDMAYGVIAIILGVITIVFSKQIGSIFRILIGLWIVYSAVMRVSLSFKFKQLDTKIWVYILILALVMLACGLYIIFNSGAIVMTIGIVILIYSVLDIVESIIFLRNIKSLEN